MTMTGSTDLSDEDAALVRAVVLAAGERELSRREIAIALAIECGFDPGEDVVFGRCQDGRLWPAVEDAGAISSVDELIRLRSMVSYADELLASGDSLEIQADGSVGRRGSLVDRLRESAARLRGATR